MIARRRGGQALFVTPFKSEERPFTAADFGRTPTPQVKHEDMPDFKGLPNERFQSMQTWSMINQAIDSKVAKIHSLYQQAGSSNLTGDALKERDNAVREMQQLSMKRQQLRANEAVADAHEKEFIKQREEVKPFKDKRATELFDGVGYNVVIKNEEGKPIALTEEQRLIKNANDTGINEELSLRDYKIESYSHFGAFQKKLDLNFEQSSRAIKSEDGNTYVSGVYEAAANGTLHLTNNPTVAAYTRLTSVDVSGNASALKTAIDVFYDNVKQDANAYRDLTGLFLDYIGLNGQIPRPKILDNYSNDELILKTKFTPKDLTITEDMTEAQKLIVKKNIEKNDAIENFKLRNNIATKIYSGEILDVNERLEYDEMLKEYATDIARSNHNKYLTTSKKINERELKVSDDLYKKLAGLDKEDDLLNIWTVATSPELIRTSGKIDAQAPIFVNYTDKGNGNSSTAKIVSKVPYKLSISTTSDNYNTVAGKFNEIAFDNILSTLDALTETDLVDRMNTTGIEESTYNAMIIEAEKRGVLLNGFASHNTVINATTGVPIPFNKLGEKIIIKKVTGDFITQRAVNEGTTTFDSNPNNQISYQKATIVVPKSYLEQINPVISMKKISGTESTTVHFNNLKLDDDDQVQYPTYGLRPIGQYDSSSFSDEALFEMDVYLAVNATNALNNGQKADKHLATQLKNAGSSEAKTFYNGVNQNLGENTNNANANNKF